MRQLPFVLTALLTVAATVPATAQDRVRISGTVRDEGTSAPISAVDLVARTPTGRFLLSTVTDEAGRFDFQVRYTPGVQLFASRIGYADNTTPVLHFDGDTFFELELRLSPDAVLLAPLEVVTRRTAERSRVLTGYHARLETGLGYYITREEIERARPSFVSDLLAQVPGVRLSSSGSGTRRAVSMARSVGHNCAVQVFVDGILITKQIMTPGGVRTEGVVIDDVVLPNSVEGIEVYRGLSTVPARFLTPEADCGVIAIWTRRGPG
jgi:hypothetical protein